MCDSDDAAARHDHCEHRQHVGPHADTTVVPARMGISLVGWNSGFVSTAQFEQPRLKAHARAHERHLFETIVEGTAGLVRKIACDNERRAAHALHAVDENPAARKKVVEMPHRLLQSPHIVAMAVDQLDAAPGEAMAD